MQPTGLRKEGSWLLELLEFPADSIWEYSSFVDCRNQKAHTSAMESSWSCMAAISCLRGVSSIRLATLHGHYRRQSIIIVLLSSVMK